jgi:threonine/homoserine/homoserine lactone efflux protein
MPFFGFSPYIALPTRRVLVLASKTSNLFNSINPKSWVVGAGAIGTYFNPGSSSVALEAAYLAALFLVCCIPSLLTWLLLGSSLQTFLKNEPAARTFNLVMGSLLAASVMMMFV